MVECPVRGRIVALDVAADFETNGRYAVVVRWDNKGRESWADSSYKTVESAKGAIHVAGGSRRRADFCIRRAAPHYSRDCVG